MRPERQLKTPTGREDSARHIAQELFEVNRQFADLVGFVKCVSLEYSSEAIWRAYSSAGGLVRLSWSFGDFLTMLQRATWPRNGKIYVAPVRHLSAPKLRVELNLFKNAKRSSQHAMRALLMKRTGFAFENEIRISYFPAARRSPAPCPPSVDHPGGIAHGSRTTLGYRLSRRRFERRLCAL